MPNTQNIQLIDSWKAVLQDEFEKPYMQQLRAFLVEQKQQDKQIFPPAKLWFNALNTTPYEKVKVVILGQDPYPTFGHAHGLSFSVLPDVFPLPKSLQNIYKELNSDLAIENKQGCLQAWAEQGVLLLNTVLTVEAGNANSHQGKGWESFTDRIITLLNNSTQPMVFILWGNNAKRKSELITLEHHLIISSPHPSPLSAHRGFFGSKPFSKANEFLAKNKREPIDWQLA